MNQALIEENKSKLLKERAHVTALLSQEGTKDGKGEFPGDYKPEFPEFGRDEGENAQEVDQFQTNLSLIQDMEKRLEKINSALHRIEDGTYGQCKFGDEIAEDRLRAVPEAETCIKHSK